MKPKYRKRLKCLIMGNYESICPTALVVDDAAFMRLGAAGYISKPFKPETFMAEIKRGLCV